MILTYPNLLDPFPYFSDLTPTPAAFAALLADGEASNLVNRSELCKTTDTWQLPRNTEATRRIN
jgi:hypothetical protein